MFIKVDTLGNKTSGFFWEMILSYLFHHPCNNSRIYNMVYQKDPGVSICLSLSNHSPYLKVLILKLINRDSVSMGTLPISEKLGSYRQHFYSTAQRSRQKQRGEHEDNQNIKTTRREG